MKLRLILILVALLTLMGVAQEEARLLRFPTTNGKQIVFTYAGDLYTVPVSGGVARKLTNHVGYEMFARFSPDGKTVAFTGQYDGNTEVFQIPAEGGVPTRLTVTATLNRDDIADRMGPNNIVMTWTNTSNEVIFRSRMRSYNSFNGSLYAVKTTGELPRELPLPRGGFSSFSPDDSKMAYNRVFREFRTWKRYKGGMADDIWIVDFKSGDLQNITENPAQDIIPMWANNGNIYFISDRTGRMNLYSYNLSTKETKQHTNYTDFDIKFPSLGPDAVVYEQAGYIHRFDLASETSAKVAIQIHEDFTASRGGLEDLSDEVTNFEIAPDGKRALFGARGEVLTVPAENGITRNLTQTSGAHERNSKWSPDGKWIAYISDASGENELWIAPQDGSGKAQQITSGADCYYYQIYWSPDSKKLLWGDNKLRLRYVDIATKKVTLVDQATAWEITQYAWAPDGSWIAYTKQDPERNHGIIHLYSVAQQKSYPVTDDWYSANSPAFSNDGKYLLFASSRDFNPIYSWTEWNHAYQDMEKVYLMTLANATDSPFKLKNDEVAVKTEAASGDKDKKKDDKKSDEKPAGVTVTVDVDGLADRTIALPVMAASYGNISCIDGVVYYNRNGSKDEKPVLLMYDLSKEKETELGNYGGYELSADLKKMLIGSGGKYAIIDLPKGKISVDKYLDLSNMQMDLDRKAEWKQIFTEAWRQMRDFFYAPNMHGLDWKAVHDKYAQLVPYANHRNDVTYLVGEMIGELNVGHAYINGGDRPRPDRVRTGLLGAELAKDASGYFRVTKILDGENWDKSTRSPLTEIGVNVKEGDFILAVNGESTANMTNIYESLLNAAGKTVSLTVNSSASATGARDVLVTPIADEASLYYFNWVRENIEKVEKATGGKVGYLHIPDMGPNGLNEFVKHFYPQMRKKALIIDVRGNGGGNVSPMLIERLRREIAMVDMSRNTTARPDPGDIHLGPMVCLVNEFSASDGDLFPYRFKHYNLGKLIGKRSWGGVVGIRGSLPFVDGADLRKPEFAPFSLDGKNWIIEGYGVDPDIFVDNDPMKEYAGEDQQLNKAIEVILEELKLHDAKLPEIPPYPVR